MAKIITIAHQKGGVGKSTLTFNLAHNFKNHLQTAVLDLDLQGTISQLKPLVDDFDILPYTDSIEKIPTLPYQVLFIDTPPYLSEHLPHLFEISDLIIIPTKAGIADIMAIRSTIDILIKSNNKDKALIVFNMVKPNTTLTSDIKAMVKEFEVPCAKTAISDLVSFTRSFVTKGVAKSKDVKAISQLEGLTEEILKKLR